VRKTIFTVFAIAFGAMSVSQPATAGARTVAKTSGETAQISCNGGGCVTKYYNKSGKLTKTSKGPGGNYNFKKIVFRLKKSGYK